MTRTGHVPANHQRRAALGATAALGPVQRLTTHPDKQGVSMTTHQQPPVLVLGGTGKVGRRIVERLTARDVPVRIGARGATPAFDWTNPATWGDVLDGARAVFISYAPDIALPR